MTKYQDLAKLSRDHPARNCPLYTIAAEWREVPCGQWRPALIMKWFTYNELPDAHRTRLAWRSPVPMLPVKSALDRSQGPAQSAGAD